MRALGILGYSLLTCSMKSTNNEAKESIEGHIHDSQLKPQLHTTKSYKYHPLCFTWAQMVVYSKTIGS